MKNVVEVEDTVIDLKKVSKVYKVKEGTRGNILKRLFGPSNYRGVVAIDEVSFNISRGEFVGLVGNNGAGKSTLVKMMTGILYNTSGEISVLGHNPYEKRLENNKRISVVFGQRTQLRWDLSPLDSFRLLKIIYDIDDKLYAENLTKFLELFEMHSFIEQPVRTLSLGQKMKCEITAAFLHNPEIVLLDEPTIGLDIYSKDAIIGFLNEMKESKQVTMILTTHDMNEISQICDRVIFLAQGKILVDESMDRLMKINVPKRDISILTYENLPVKIQNSYGLDISYGDHKIEIKQVENKIISNVIDEVMKHNQVQDITIEKESFTNIVKKIYEGQNS